MYALAHRTVAVEEGLGAHVNESHVRWVTRDLPIYGPLGDFRRENETGSAIPLMRLRYACPVSSCRDRENSAWAHAEKRGRRRRYLFAERNW